MVPIETCWKRKRRGHTWRVMIGRNPVCRCWCGYVAVPGSVMDLEKYGVAPPGDSVYGAPEEITFCEAVDGMGRVIGFDTGHAWDRMHPPTEKEIRRRANRFADWAADSYFKAAYREAMRHMENQARKFAMRKTEEGAENRG